ncbi:carbonic anhydrase 2-like [Haliotis rufescens]|uniref:carbonic anhydrase 2-like n=1 Tax=Haliotis rufescens TaxID=6454 RepID=UPI00201EB088|nr:carbonic anhydrase 2-like [Haliotis rufescens]
MDDDTDVLIADNERNRFVAVWRLLTDSTYKKCALGLCLGVIGITVITLVVVFVPRTSGPSEDLCPPTPSVAFSYNSHSAEGPLHWSHLAPGTRCCAGSFQSPINIQTQSLHCRGFTAITYQGSQTGALNGNISSMGQGAVLVFSMQHQLVTRVLPEVTDDYVLDSMHFHCPSEHHVDGKAMPGELHLVHYKKQYGSIAAAAAKQDGLAVIGIFLESGSSSNNSAFNAFLDGVQKLNKAGNGVSVTLDPRQLMPPGGKFYTYFGSLTTPSCSESVRWIVMQNPIVTTQEKVQILRTLKVKDAAHLSVHGNARPLQSLNSRRVDSNTC